MLQFDRYEKPATPEQALELAKKRGTVLLGGGGWLRLGTRKVPCAVDLSACVGHEIEETETSFRIGAMTTLRAFETNAALNAAFGGAMRDCVCGIVGVQFRNLATVGGSIWGRFGFSDIWTLLLALDARAVLCARGEMPLTQFAALPRAEKDVLLAVEIPKPAVPVAIRAERTTASDLPLLTCAVAKLPDGTARVAVGARPVLAKAQILPWDSSLPDRAAEAFSFGSNSRASGAYRKILCRALVRRCMEALA